ncbi:hypothetical protein OEZ85_008942 [Tetradesmus obliquus]|uniref:Uncharacterized protein n=1 Tax=Tetradesmus obliquus TaxID=3088 RepID=A0ABY8TKB0_TETOB|nr:hypothetical protein OEZ85_008942 [Tetradesmus obliquus]
MSEQRPRHQNINITTATATSPSTAPTNAGRTTTGQQCYNIGYVTLARSGLSYGDNDEYGRLIDFNGNAIVRPVFANDSFSTLLSADEVKRRQLWSTGARVAHLHSNNPDFPSWHEVDGRTFVINHFEYPQPSTAYISELAQDPQTKQLRMVNTSPVDDRDVNGMWFMCRGEKTPWGIHMGSEEYPPDCRAYEVLFLPCKQAVDLCGYADTSDGEGIIEFARFYGYYNDAQDHNETAAAFGANATNMADFKTKFSCYNYGSSPEIGITSGNGSTNITKWRTLGRISHETAWFMPDNRTIYTSDDGTNGILLKFMADAPADSWSSQHLNSARCLLLSLRPSKAAARSLTSAGSCWAVASRQTLMPWL